MKIVKIKKLNKLTGKIYTEVNVEINGKLELVGRANNTDELMSLTAAANKFIKENN